MRIEWFQNGISFSMQALRRIQLLYLDVYKMYIFCWHQLDASLPGNQRPSIAVLRCWCRWSFSLLHKTRRWSATAPRDACWMRDLGPLPRALCIYDIWQTQRSNNYYEHIFQCKLRVNFAENSNNCYSYSSDWHLYILRWKFRIPNKGIAMTTIGLIWNK